MSPSFLSTAHFFTSLASLLICPTLSFFFFLEMLSMGNELGVYGK